MSGTRVPTLVAHSYNFRTQEAKAGKSWHTIENYELESRILFQNKRLKTIGENMHKLKVLDNAARSIKQFSYMKKVQRILAN